jgi:hemerythrin-like domain-containing protein
MKPTDVLQQEHEIILVVLDAAQREAESIAGTGQLKVDRIEEMVDFFRTFTDGCHHAKEEKRLFMEMKNQAGAAAGPISVMLHDHEAGRQHVRTIADLIPRAREGDRDAVHAIQLNLEAYVALLRMHIHKENNILFPMATRLLPPEVQEQLLRDFERIESEQMGDGVHERYHRLAHQLAEKL